MKRNVAIFVILFCIVIGAFLFYIVLAKCCQRLVNKQLDIQAAAKEEAAAEAKSAA